MIDPREIELLRLLFISNTGIPRNILLERLNLSAVDFENLIKSLENDGYGLELNDDIVRLAFEPDSLRPQGILARLETQIIGHEIFVFSETSSTNDLARRAGLGGGAEGTVFFAEQQTAGRGTQGRKWVSSANQGLWFSILLRSELPVDRLPGLVQMAAVAATEEIEKWMVEPVNIKPPNDLVVHGGKLAGFLLETSNAWDFQVLGIGINVKSAPQIEGYPTAALEQFSHSRVPLAKLAAGVLNRFEEWYLEKSLAQLIDAFVARLLPDSC